MTTITVFFIPPCHGAAYSDATKLFDDKLGSSYKTTVRPLLNQSHVLNVTVSFNIIAIVTVDAIEQKFVVNGFMNMEWTDEMVSWTPSDYDDIYFIHPEPKQIWRPRLIVGNTLGARDLFEDDHCPVTIAYDGSTSWNPGSLFPTACKLDMYKFPFDEQQCYIDMFSMGSNFEEINFLNDNDRVSVDFYTKSGEWEITGRSIDINNGGATERLPSFQIGFQLKRLPGFFVVNIVTPIVLMSFLNILVFLIPVDSGEKISYGITVLLALTVFMSLVSSQLPRTSDKLPLLTIYLLVLTVISVWTVIMSIVIVYVHHREEREYKHQKAVTGFRSLFSKISSMSRAGKSFSKAQVQPASVQRQFSKSSITEDKGKNSGTAARQGTVLDILNHMKDKKSSDRLTGEDREGNEGGGEGGDDCAKVNRWKLLGKHLDFVSFLVFTVIWISVTIGFLVAIAS